MKNQTKVNIRKLPTGVTGLDEILGGGLPEFSFNIIAGAPGGGKTTLAHQIMFANATPERPAVFFTVLGEPAFKMLRYQQQYEFFDQSKISSCIHFVNLSSQVLNGNLDSVYNEIVKVVTAIGPSIVMVDSFRTVVRGAKSDETDLQGFIQRLALFLASWQATTFLIGEYTDEEVRNNPVFTVADGLFWLYQQVERNSIVRKMQIAKLRGQASIPGMHTFRITNEGVHTFPRTFGLTSSKERVLNHRLSFGIAELDAMTNGGLPLGDSMLVAGPSGTGKSIIATQFIAEGLRIGEPGVVVIFEERPEEYAFRASTFGLDWKKAQENGTLNILYLRPLDLSVDETVLEVLEAVKKSGAKRLIIDSLAGFEMALAPSFRTDFRESLYRMMSVLTRIGVTIISTMEVEESFTELQFSAYSISFLCDDIIRLRYVEIDSELRRILMVVKMRGGNHSKEIREYFINSPEGMSISQSKLSGYKSLITGVPEAIKIQPEI